MELYSEVSLIQTDTMCEGADELLGEMSGGE